jgi:organic hydroperoxide reductase OsmC/OhrA
MTRERDAMSKTWRWVIPGSRLLPTDRAALLQSGSPPDVHRIRQASNLSFVICHLSSVIAAMPSHHYSLTTVWTGNTGKGTSGYRDYERSYDVRIPEKPVLAGSSDPKFRGDPTRYNPEDLLVASLSACHMLWYLHLCSDQKIICTHYSDAAEGEMEITTNGVGRFTKVVLRPDIVITSEAGLKAAHELHERAHALCFIANSVNFPVEVSPTIRVGS